MPGRLIRLRYAATCSGCAAALPAKTRAWWDAGTKTVRCQACEGAPRPVVPAAELRRGVAGGSALHKAETKRSLRETTIRSHHPRIGGLILALTDEPQDIKNWAKGAEGERKLGAGLDGLAGAGVVTLHDRLRPGGGQANIDHIAVTPAGVWVIDAKRYAGQVAKKDVGGWLSTDVRLYVGRRNCSKLVAGMAKQVDAVRRVVGDEWGDVPVRPMLCFVDADWQWFARPFELDGVLVTWPRAARERLSQPGPYDAGTVAQVAARLDQRLRPAS